MTLEPLLALATRPVARAQGRHRGASRPVLVLFVFALLGAGAFTLVPGRLMHAVISGPAAPDAENEINL
jgi:uncharacterized membrane protein